MGKKLIIPGADFSENGIVIPLTIIVKAGGSVTIGDVTYSADVNKNSVFEIVSIPSNFTLSYNNDILYMRFGSPFSIPSITGAFRNLEEIEEIVFSAPVNTSTGVAATIFANCRKLKKFDGTNFYFNAANGSQLFYSCNAMKEVKNMLHITPSIENLSYTFGDCYELEYVDLSALLTANCTTMQEMFRSNRKLHTVMFGEGLSLASNPTVTKMFDDCGSLQDIYAPSLTASDYNVSGTDTYKFIQGITSSTGHVTIHCGTGTLIWNGSTWIVN